MAPRCWFCGHAHVTPCPASWRQLDEEGVCGCVRTPAESEEAVVNLLAPAIAEAMRGPGAKVRKADIRRARESLHV